MAHSRNKGLAFEQAIARDLRAWLGDDYSVDRLRTDQQQGDEHAGEFAITGPVRFPFAVELKNHASFRAVHLWRANKQFADWWEQAARQAQACGRLPMLVINIPRKPVLCVMRVVHARKMWITGHDPTMNLHLDDGTPEGENLWVGLWDHVRTHALWQEVA